MTIAVFSITSMNMLFTREGSTEEAWGRQEEKKGCMATLKMFARMKEREERKKGKIKVSFRTKTTLILQVHSNPSEAASAPPHFINMNIIF